MLSKVFFLQLFVLISTAFGQVSLTRIVPSESVVLRDPSAISVAPDGSLIISDTGHNRVLSIDSEGKLLFEVGSMGSGAGEFLWPKDVAAAGIVIWVADYGNRRVSKLSRQFDSQGSLIVMDDSGSSSEQIEKIAASPQGDVYLFAEDSGRLLRYDPLFNLQGALGSFLGQSFIPPIRQLVFVTGKGVIWHSRGDKYLSFSDPLLTFADILPTEFKNLGDNILASSGSSLIVAGLQGIFRTSFEGDSAEVLLSEITIKEAGIKSLDDIVVTNTEAVFILESRAGSIYHVNLKNR